MSKTQYNDSTFEDNIYNLCVCLNCEYLKSVLQKNILKYSQKTTYVFTFVGEISLKSNKNWLNLE
jgi:hypothetical protein